MTRVVIAKSPDLSFLTVGKTNPFTESVTLPIILKSGGKIDWDANFYITQYAGGANVYNIRPLATTVSNKAYSLNLFCQFLENSSIELHRINDNSMYRYVDNLKYRCITDSTIISHVRTALGYVQHLNSIKPEWNLATKEIEPGVAHRVHYSIERYREGRFEKSYLSHRCLDGLIHIKTEAEFIRDDEYLKWLNAINVSSFHPEVDKFLLMRWKALGTLLEITGSRISEINLITREMIKNASKNMLDATQKHIIRGIKIAKGKYKGKTRNVPVAKEDLQVLMIYIDILENRFPDSEHDALFVDAKSGSKLKQSYLKNYARKVINSSPYAQDLRHIINHSFRHRFITLHIAKAIIEISRYGSFTNILNVAADACRKLTMHASNKTLSHYIHLATEINESNNLNTNSGDILSSHIRSRVLTMINVSDKLSANQLNEKEALALLLTELDEFKKLNMLVLN